ncbi:MAG: polymer-forming cytoskeletal protein [Firmicutes bacterium]|jgi:cytoskeletal protein CcmA (bactofilin family)|nr:polymer-forming cytoskeletal protein [Bacillota bacterium]MCR4725218.1 polymer-forming cytoskeletal protein [Clostridia bacterium]MBQ4410174.1 polymer-forming cytoskeletal protein [Bacillota bacterium]MBQ6294299.1 polymer-forming cytoskeletal protein [Bacillota bacterium]MBR0050389.1 polymer-forming cytoskeletal protein [Bacillota bacterium]
MAYNDFENASTSVDSVIVETAIGVDTVFKGSINTNKPIRIDGHYEGEINSDNLIIITETGFFSGDMKCRELQLQGKGEGTVVCTELMQLSNTGAFRGNIATKDIILVKGSQIDGQIDMASMR